MISETLSPGLCYFQRDPRGSSVCYHYCLWANRIDSPCFLSTTLPPVKLLVPRHISPHSPSATFSRCQCSNVVRSVSPLSSDCITLFCSSYELFTPGVDFPILPFVLLLPPPPPACQSPPPSRSCRGPSATTTGASPSA